MSPDPAEWLATYGDLHYFIWRAVEKDPELYQAFKAIGNPDPTLSMSDTDQEREEEIVGDGIGQAVHQLVREAVQGKFDQLPEV